MNLPSVDVKFIFVVGFFAFGIQAIANIFLFFINFRGHNIFSASISWGSILFACVLAYFFWYSYKGMSETNISVTEGEVAVDDDTMKLIDDIKKGGGGVY